MLRLVRTGVVVAVALALTVLLAVALSRSAPRSAGHNDIRETGPAVALANGDEACQPGQAVPQDAAFVELNATPAQGRAALPGLAVALRAGERSLGSGRVSAGSAPGRVRIPVGRVERSEFPATVCVRNLGRDTLTLVGAPGAKGEVEVDGKTVDGLFRVAYVRAGSESWFEILGVLAHRFSLAKANWVGAWTFWALGLALVGMLAITVRIALGDEPEVER